MSKTPYRTYMPGYDLGDWLTLKEDKILYSAIKITNISTDSGYNYYTPRHPKEGFEELYISVENKFFKPRKNDDTWHGIKQQLTRGQFFEPSTITYADLLTKYRPLTTSEKLLYISEDEETSKKPFSWGFDN